MASWELWLLLMPSLTRECCARCCQPWKRSQFRIQYVGAPWWLRELRTQHFSLLWLRLLLCCRCHPWFLNFCMLQVWPKKKKSGYGFSECISFLHHPKLKNKSDHCKLGTLYWEHSLWPLLTNGSAT